MAINWGNWEGGSMRMRVGIDVDVETITHGDQACTFTVRYYTENNFTWDDDQSLNLGGAIDGSIGFHNGQGGAVTQRGGARTHVYDYPNSSYGDSPGTRTFSATLNGAYNGITPSCSVTRNIPARPIAAPAAPGAASVSRVSDEANKITWNNHPSAGEPYGTIRVQRYIYGHDDWSTVATPGGGAESYTDYGAIPNRSYIYRVRAENGAGDSGWDNTGIIWTSPATPTNCARTTSGANQVVSWTNNTDYVEYETEVWHAVGGVWDSAPLIRVADGVTSYTHVAPNSTQKHSYRVRARSTSGSTLYSSYSGTTTESSGTTTAPSAPTNLDPAGVIVAPDDLVVMTWKHNPTDGSKQTAFSIQHREYLTSTWTTVAKTTSASSSYTLPANTYAKGKKVEWQVQTWGASATASPWSASAVFDTQALVTVKYPLYLDPTTGRVEANSSGSAGSGAVSLVSAKLVHPGSTFQLIPDSVWTKITVDTEIYDTAGMANPATSSITIPEDGKYGITGYVEFETYTASTGYRRIVAIGINAPGGGATTNLWGVSHASSGSQVGARHYEEYDLKAGDVITLYAFQNSGKAGGLLTERSASGANWGVVLGATKIGGAKGDTGPPGPPGASGASVSYVHTQTPLSSSWVIAHNLNKYPSVTVVDTGDNQILPNVHYDSANQVTVTFGAATSGKAYVN